MMRTCPLLLCSLTSILACATPAPTEAPPDRSPKLIQDAGRWFVTGLQPETVKALYRGALFAVYRPVAGIDAQRPIATFKMVDRTSSSGGTVEVATFCVVEGERVDAHLIAAPLDQRAMPTVGQCLAQVVSKTEQNGHLYVTLNVGRGNGVRPGDEYLLLGKPVVEEVFVPIGIDYKDDIRCKVPRNDAHLKIVTSRCRVMGELSDGRSIGRHAVYVDRL